MEGRGRGESGERAGFTSGPGTSVAVDLMLKADLQTCRRGGGCPFPPSWSGRLPFSASAPGVRIRSWWDARYSSGYYHVSQGRAVRATAPTGLPRAVALGWPLFAWFGDGLVPWLLHASPGPTDGGPTTRMAVCQCVLMPQSMAFDKTPQGLQVYGCGQSGHIQKGTGHGGFQISPLLTSQEKEQT